jgi:hypothetical protein
MRCRKPDSASPYRAQSSVARLSIRPILAGRPAQA